MHDEAYAWVSRFASNELLVVLDLGGRDINGNCRPLFPNAGYTVLDIAAGPNVDIVADAATWTPDREYDVVVCTEVFEHTPVWPDICQTAFKACKSGGLVVLTMAGPGRPAHSGVDGGWQLHPGEHYRNVYPHRLKQVLEQVGFVEVVVDQQHSPADVRAVAVRP